MPYAPFRPQISLSEVFSKFSATLPARERKRQIIPLQLMREMFVSADFIKSSKLHAQAIE